MAMATAGTTYDFIIVGAGPAGCLAAATLAKSKQKPKVLLIEAGGENNNRAARIDAERWLTKMVPEQNWSYKTIPQKSMNNRVLDYDRGKGLGGSSAINFSCYTVAPADDHDEIARLTGDDEWKWVNAHKRYRRIESYHGTATDAPAGRELYLAPKSEDHGDSGPIKIGFPATWEKAYIKEMDSFAKAGYQSNFDINNGTNLGIGCVPNTAFQGVRSTAADALIGSPENLHIRTDSQVAKVIFDGKTATGVALVDGTILNTSKEVIISAGSIDSPKIIMLSGIGPADQLSKLGIPIVDDNKAVGKNLQEHPLVFMSFPRHQDVSKRLSYYRDPEAQAEARKQWEENSSGPLTEIACQVSTVFVQHKAVLETPEFEALPPATKSFLQKPGVPTSEYMINVPNLDLFMDPHNAPIAAWFCCMLMTPMSRGEVILSSADPSTPVTVDVNMLSHPYDLKNVIITTKELLRIGDSEPDSKVEGAQYLLPKSDSDEDILEFWKQTCSVTWHASGTLKMGRDANEEDTCVDQDFKVHNVKNLRVADLSVVPFVTNCHTQATAYLVGVMIGDRLIQEYELDK